jgi:hypothetical protein
VLVVAGGLEGVAGDRLGERVEEQQVGLEVAGLPGAAGLPLAIAPEERVAGSGDLGAGAGADVGADHAAVDAAGAVVIPLAVLAADFPGHGAAPEAGEMRGATQKPL